MRSAREPRRAPCARLLGVLLAASAALGATVAGCTIEDEEPVEPPKALAQRECPPDSVLTYENFGGPFIYSYCSGCHSKDLPEGMRQDAPLQSDFDTLASTRLWAARIWARAADHNTTMPPIGGPDDEDRERLGEWLACGAPSLE
ncbi:MAG: hypothetical protein U0414_40215 [Polyangiaceae bacterium]